VRGIPFSRAALIGFPTPKNDYDYEEVDMRNIIAYAAHICGV
jgi:hypothetical protein